MHNGTVEVERNEYSMWIFDMLTLLMGTEQHYVKVCKQVVEHNNCDRLL